ncbi:SRPBCC domain-containing protein [Maritimibacter sp. DP1N21-5]|uniref:SRPBCC domain-containing protein n=1 Tax=Maritimibacter sp. DP1N21-5 TaxID=2836867 RepID=UPI001C47999F|nr:SRPBCC domain-containing protein [Maritimibacter sp. DP1N21-5]MBV7408686.1 SRPBCC domain-containing protein [Maritimibacter sp. DP1N21-5]
MTDRTDTASRVIRATPEAIWQAQVDPVRLARWLPPEGATMEVLALNPVPGGDYHLRLTFAETTGGQGKTDATTDEVNGRFVTLAPLSQLVQDVDFVSDDPAFSGTMRMTWDMTPVEGGTRVTITATHVPEGISAESHLEGLTSSLDNLAREVET